MVCIFEALLLSDAQQSILESARAFVENDDVRATLGLVEDNDTSLCCGRIKGIK